MPIDNPVSVAFSDITALKTNRPLVLPGGRISLSATDPLASGSGSSTLCYLAYGSSIVPVWNNAENCWEYRPIPENGIVLNRPTDNPRVVDVYAELIPDRPDTLGLDIQSWSTNTNRLIPLARKHGVYVVAYSGGTTPLKTYLGSVQFVGASGSARLFDNESQRLIFNAYNQVIKPVAKRENTGSFFDNTTTWKPFFNSTANRIEVLDGVGYGVLDLTFLGRAAPATGSYAQFGLGIDMANNINSSFFVCTGDNVVSTRFSNYVGQGSHYVQAMQSTVGSATYYSGAAHGLFGSWYC